jgi:hypothetical protein
VQGGAHEDEAQVGVGRQQVTHLGGGGGRGAPGGGGGGGGGGGRARA